MIKNAIVSSLKDLKLTLFWPAALNYLSQAILGLLFLWTSGIGKELLNKPLPFGHKLILQTVHETQIFMHNNLVTFIVNLLIFIILHFVVGSSLDSLRYSTMVDILNKKNHGIFKGCINGYKHAKEKWLSIVYLKALTYILFSISIALGRLPTNTKILSGPSIMVLLILTTAILLFSYASLFIENKSVIGSLQSSIRLFKKNISLCLGIASVITTITLVITSVLNNLLTTNLFVLILLIQLILTVWKDMFIFTIFKLKLAKNH